MDRSGAYAARYIAKNIVAAGLAKRCEVQLAYAIGVAHPVSVLVDTFGTGTVSEEALSKAVLDVFQLTPDGIIRMLVLRKPRTGSWLLMVTWVVKIWALRGNARTRSMH